MAVDRMKQQQETMQRKMKEESERKAKLEVRFSYMAVTTYNNSNIQ